ncbi:MAG: PaaI family thioesterase [Myxococcales bacterium]|nr:PaaI family thioesterase [Myxococcales bacterium]
MSDALGSEATAAIEQFIVGAPYGKLLEIRCDLIEPDHVRLRLPFRNDVTTLGEMVHGGAIASLVDVAATAAAWAHPKASLKARGTTVGFSLNFLAPGLGRDLVADARIVQRGRSLCVLEVGVEDENGDAVARAMVTYKLALPK